MEGCAQQLLCRMAQYTPGALMLPIRMVPQDGHGAMWSHRLNDPKSFFPPKQSTKLLCCSCPASKARGDFAVSI